MQVYKESILSFLFVMLYLVAAVRLGVGLPMTNWYGREQDGMLLGSIGSVSLFVVFIWVVIANFVRQNIHLFRPQAIKVTSNEKKFRWLSLHYYFSHIVIPVVLAAFVLAFALFIWLVMKPFSLWNASLVGICFEGAYVLFVQAFMIFRSTTFGMDTVTGASAFALLAQKLLEENNKDGLHYLGISLSMARQALSKEGFSHEESDRLDSIVNLFQSHANDVPFKELAVLASGIANLPLYKKFSEAVENILSLPQFAWTKMYHGTRGRWRTFFKLFSYVLAISAVVASLLPEEPKRSLLKFVSEASTQGLGEVVLLLAAYFALPYLWGVTYSAFVDSLSRKHLIQMKHLWIEKRD